MNIVERIAKANPEQRIIVGLAGKKRAGKDSIAHVLTSEYGFAHDSFAAPIREFVEKLTEDYSSNVFSIDGDRETAIDWLGGKSKRQLMQTLGTEWGRDMVSPTLWMDALWRRTGRATTSFHRLLVISDVRFDDEADFIRSKGGIIIHVVRPGLNGGDGHVSEYGVHKEDIDATLHNDGDLNHLQWRVHTALVPFVAARYLDIASSPVKAIGEVHVAA